MNFTFRGNVFKVSAIRKPELPMAAMFFLSDSHEMKNFCGGPPIHYLCPPFRLVFSEEIESETRFAVILQAMKIHTCNDRIVLKHVLHISFLWRKCTNNSDISINWLITTVVKFSIRIHATFLTPVIKIFLTLWS